MRAFIYFLVAENVAIEVAAQLHEYGLVLMRDSTTRQYKVLVESIEEYILVGRLLFKVKILH